MSSKTMMLTWLSVGITAALLSGCGGGGGGAAAPSSTVVNGIASAGPLNGSTVCAFAITAGAKGAQIGTCATNTVNGNYSINLGTHTGLALFEATGGNYVDEATGLTTPLASPLRSTLVNAAGGTASVAVTPLTEIAYLGAIAAGGLTSANIQTAITTVQNNFGVADIIGTLPVDALNVPAGAMNAQMTYALALATVSQYQNLQPSGTSLSAALQSVQACLAAPTTGCGVGAANAGTALSTALTTFQAGHTAFVGMTLPVANFGSVVTVPPQVSPQVAMLVGTWNAIIGGTTYTNVVTETGFNTVNMLVSGGGQPTQTGSLSVNGSAAYNGVVMNQTGGSFTHTVNVVNATTITTVQTNCTATAGVACVTPNGSTATWTKVAAAVAAAVTPAPVVPAPATGGTVVPPAALAKANWASPATITKTFAAVAPAIHKSIAYFSSVIIQTNGNFTGDAGTYFLFAPPCNGSIANIVICSYTGAPGAAVSGTFNFTTNMVTIGATSYPITVTPTVITISSYDFGVVGGPAYTVTLK